MKLPLGHFWAACCLAVALSSGSLRAEPPPNPLTIGADWRLQDATAVPQDGAAISRLDFDAGSWHPAVVPGTVLTSLVNDGIYAEPLYGENNRPDKIPESLCRTPYWYRTVCTIPTDYSGKRIWLNFDGINYSAEVWLNGRSVGSIRGAFTRGIFDVTSLVQPGQPAALAVEITPQPHPGVPHEHTLAAGMGPNGGITAIDGPTFLCTIGWDWIPAIRDRDSGIWRKVFLSASGAAVIKNPLITTDVSLPGLETAEVAVQATLENVSDAPYHGEFSASFDDVSVKQSVEIPPRASITVALSPTNAPDLRLYHPKLWWPNGYGPQNLHTMHLALGSGDDVSDASEVNFGIRKITYSVPDSENLTLSVNGVRVYCKGGDWGMDEAMKRIPRARLDAEIHMHQMAHMTIIRNWVGQSTSEDFYDMCDKYGILLWDEFFQPNPSDGPNADDLATYVANVREKILRYRNHPAIAIWCARNEGFPPKEIDDELRKMMAELEPTRLYQPSSTSGHGVNSGGPYSSEHPPRTYYDFNDPFKTEIGSVSIPTLDSIQGMMPPKDWESINDDWAEHDLARGASGGEALRGYINGRYGEIRNLADFVRKGQLLNYETFRAIYEGREAKLFNPSTAVIIWMSNPAQPSFVWQLYHHDLEPNASLFAVEKACEPVHIMLNQKTGHAMILNNHPEGLSEAAAKVILYNLDGSRAFETNLTAQAAPSAATDLGLVPLADSLSAVYFVELTLADKNGSPLSRNFYWRAREPHPDDLTALTQMEPARLVAEASRRTEGGNCMIDVKLTNPTSRVALLAHAQLRRAASGQRVLPVFYSDNYVSLAPGESTDLTITVAEADLQGETPLVTLDGWNIEVDSLSTAEVGLRVNANSQPNNWPETGLPIVSSAAK